MRVDAAFDQLRRANPEPDPEALLVELKQSTPGTLEKRNVSKAITTPEKRRTKEASPVRRKRSWNPALALGLVLLAMMIALIPKTRSAVLSFFEPSALEVANEYMTARNAYDAETARALVAPDAVLGDMPRMDYDEFELGFESLRVYELSYDPFECEVVRTVPSEMVSCVYQLDTNLSRTVGYPPVEGSFVFTIEDGLITRLANHFPHAEYAPNVFIKFYNWLQENHPGAYEQVFYTEGGTDSPILTQDALAMLAAYMEEYDRAING